jgi:hypothetical protein
MAIPTFKLRTSLRQVLHRYQIFLTILVCFVIEYYRKVLTFVDRITACGPAAARRIRILPMNQYA